MDGSTPSLSSSEASPASTVNAPDIPLQPAFFYPNGQNAKIPANLDGLLSPDQDPLATRGIPVFKPTMEEFHDFEKYMERVEIWGRKSGIVKVIPPKEWSDALPPVNHQLPSIRLKSPIEQHMIGQAGLFRQNNIEKRRTLNLREWAELCNKETMRAPPIKDGSVRTRGIARLPPRPKRKGKSKAEIEIKDEDPQTDSHLISQEHDTKVHSAAESRAQSIAASDSSSHPGATYTNDQKTAPSIKDEKDNEFFANFDPLTSWTPDDTRPEDYTPEACHELERLFWRTCGFGVPALYGADMAGSLFTERTTEWNVARLPSFLSRLKGINQLPGVNTPYLYFGMWRATFAWHVEDMDLYSINYIHWGAPKHWYAIPSGRSKAFEGVMRGFFPGDPCPQFLRHKSYLASPTLLTKSNCRPNLLVQHQGEFVITYPRGYHAGFNLGLNCAESVNFALESWIELGRKAGVCKCVGDSVRIDVDALLDDAERQRDQELQGDQEEAISKKRKIEDGTDALDSEPNPVIHPTLKRLKIIQTYEPPAGQVSLTDAPRPSESTGENHVIRPKIRLSTTPITPCCLCASSDRRGLLRVHESCVANGYLKSLSDKDGKAADKWQAHEQCARAVPETWVEEVDGQKMVFGVDAIVKDRWNLKCSICTRNVLREYGAKVQCTKGKCPKAFHVSCAIAAEDVSFRELKEVEKEVMVVGHPLDKRSKHAAEVAFINEMVMDEWQVQCELEVEPHTYKTIRKPGIELLCSQHNPSVQQRKKEAKMEQIKRDVLSLPPESRIRIRNQSGVYEVTLVSVHEDRNSIVVVWGDGERKEFKWSSIVWGQVPEGTVVRQAEYEMGPVRTSRAAASSSSTYAANPTSKPPPQSSQVSSTPSQSSPAQAALRWAPVQPPSQSSTYQYPYGYMHPSHSGPATYYPPPHYYPPTQGHPQYRGYINQKAPPQPSFYYYPAPQVPAASNASTMQSAQVPRPAIPPSPALAMGVAAIAQPQARSSSVATVAPPPPNAYIVPAYPPNYYHGYGYGYPAPSQYGPYMAYPNQPLPPPPASTTAHRPQAASTSSKPSGVPPSS
ncbi:hypothetical protein FRC02_003334 [Tulasnella sp. 418]|nr:hypothetical protein FRC02_003334 [Tulasnella sp. 418]